MSTITAVLINRSEVSVFIVFVFKGSSVINSTKIARFFDLHNRKSTIGGMKMYDICPKKTPPVETRGVYITLTYRNGLLSQNILAYPNFPLPVAPGNNIGVHYAAGVHVLFPMDFQNSVVAGIDIVHQGAGAGIACPLLVRK